jgi:hypothetical protein
MLSLYVTRLYVHCQKIKIKIVRALETDRKVSQWFRSKCKLIWYLPTMYIFCVHPAMSKCQKQLPHCLKITGTSVFIIVFNCRLWSVYAVTVSWRGVLDTTLCDKVCQCFATNLWFSSGYSGFRHQYNKSDCYDMTKICLKAAK